MKKLFTFVIFVSLTNYFFSQPVIHFSIDDVSQSLCDLTKNEKKYKTAFEQPFFSYLNKLNKKYGVIFSLYCFFEHNGFTLADCTDKFSKDFAENSSWLKFGYHAWNPNVTFNHNIVKGGYDMFINEMERITGTKESITSTVRLDYFKGEKYEIQQVSYEACNKGISSLLCADSKTRSSYFLTQTQEEQLNMLETIQIDELTFYETDFRFDDYENFEKLCLENLDEKELIVFTHEWLLYVPFRRNILKYLNILLQSRKVKRNIDFFLKYCIMNDYIFVTDF